MSRYNVLWIVLVAIAVDPIPASGTVIVTFQPATPVIGLGDSVNVEIRATATDPVLGFGIDVEIGSAALVLSAPLVIGPLWTPVFAPDGDGLAGLVFPSGVSGADLLLATITLLGSSPGTAVVSGSFTPGDLAEGFPLDPIGFDPNVSFFGAAITVIPEPATIGMVLSGMALLAMRPYIASTRNRRDVHSAAAAGRKTQRHVGGC